MTSVPGNDTIMWNDEQTRFYLQLRIEEKLKGNVRNQLVNEAGRQTITEKFYEEFGVKHAWIKFRNKFNTCKRQYEALKKLTHRTGLGYHQNGTIDMSDYWWEQRCKEWPGARKLKEKPVPNTNLLEQVFGAVHVTGAEGWSAQQGENELDNMELERDDAASEARQTNSTNHETDVPSASNAPRDSTVPSASNAPRDSAVPSASNVPRDSTNPSASNVPRDSTNPSASNAPRPSTVSKLSRKRRAEKAADVIRSSLQSRDEILAHKNHLIESHPDLSCSQLKAMKVLHSLSTIRMWSPLYKAAMKHLKEAATN